MEGPPPKPFGNHGEDSGCKQDLSAVLQRGPTVSVHITWLCLKWFLFLSLARGVPGEGPDCHFPKEIAGFGAIPARFRKILIFILALSTARIRLKGPLGS